MFLNVCKQKFHISHLRISQKLKCVDVETSAYYYHVKRKILWDFQICISVPLKWEGRKKSTIHKSGLSNLLVHRTKSIVKLIIFVFSFALKVVLPNSKVCISEKSVLSNNLRSILTKLLRSVRRSLLFKGQWRKKWIADSTW